MGNALNLFPTRAAIGTVTPSGQVLQTPEFARALADLLARVGGPSGFSITEIMQELERRPSTLMLSADPIVLSGSTSATILASVPVPANAMGKNGMVRITTTWSVTNNERNKTIITRFGGSDIARNAITTVSTYQEQRIIQNRAAGMQVFVFGGFSYTGAPIATLQKDTRQAQVIEIVGQLDNTADSMTLEAYSVELIPSI